MGGGGGVGGKLRDSSLTNHWFNSNNFFFITQNCSQIMEDNSNNFIEPLSLSRHCSAQEIQPATKHKFMI